MSLALSWFRVSAVVVATVVLVSVVRFPVRGQGVVRCLSVLAVVVVMVAIQAV